MTEKNLQELKEEVRKLEEEYKKNTEEIFSKKTPERVEEEKQWKEIEKINGLKGEFIKDAKEGIYSIVNYLLEKYNFKTIAGRYDELYVYLDGVFLLKGEQTIKQEVEKVLKEHSSTHFVGEIIEKVKRNSFIDRSDFENKDNNLIPLENGVLDIRTGELKGHNPDYLFRFKIPVIYDPNVDCPRIKQFFGDIFYEEDIETMVEWFGFCLYKSYFLKKALIMVGDADTGKSTALDLLVKFIGEENISNVSLHKIASDKFATSNLYQKLVNVYDDLDFKDITNVGRFKTAVGIAPLEAEKKYKDAFSFSNFAKLTFTTNRIPPSKDKDANDNAYYGRWVIIRCDNIVDEKDPQLLEKLTTKEELSGLLNWALVGLKRILEKGQFSYQKSWQEIKAFMDRSANPLVAFVQDELKETDKESWLSKEDLYNAYSQYAEENNLPVMTIDRIGKNLPKLFYFFQNGDQAHIIRGGRQTTIRVWKRVAFKNPEKYKKEDDLVGNQEL